MKLYEIVFSATGRTQRVADIMGKVWTEEKAKIDLTEQTFDGSGYGFSPEDLCIVAVSVYGGRVPSVAAKRLKTLNGCGARAIPVAVYGNRAVDDALLELKDILLEQGFLCVAAMEAVAEHSMMPRFGAGRPDDADRSELTRFAEQIRVELDAGRLSNCVEVPGNRPYVHAHNLPLDFKADKKCTKCGKCAIQCPVGAIPKENPASVDTSKCIRCMRCTAVCPVGAKHMPGWIGLVAPLMGRKLGGRKENQLYI